MLNRGVREVLTEKKTFCRDLREVSSHMDVWGKKKPDRKDSECKGSGTEKHLGF